MAGRRTRFASSPSRSAEAALTRIRSRGRIRVADAVFGTIGGPEPRLGGRIMRPFLNERRTFAVADSYDAARQRARTYQPRGSGFRGAAGTANSATSAPPQPPAGSPGPGRTVPSQVEENESGTLRTEMRTATLRNFARPGPCRPARRNPLRRALAHRRKGGPGVRGIVGRDHSSLRRLRRQHPRPHHAKSGAARLVWTPPVMQAFWRARCVKYIHVSRRLCRPRTAIRGPGQSSVAHKKCSWFTRDRLPLLSLRPCPRRPAQALSDPGKPFSRQPARPSAPAPSSSAAPKRCAPLAKATATSFGGLVASASHEPVAHRFAHRTTDMAPMLCHADPCRALPCRPCCLLPALNRARPRSRALSFPGAKAAEAVPTPGMLSLESSSSFVVSLLLGDLPVQTPVAVGRPRCTG